jgi:diguanylate cyclase (GGDEF)-like protein
VSTPDLALAAAGTPRPRRLFALAAFTYALLLGAWIYQAAAGSVPFDASWIIFSAILVIYAGLSLVAVRRRPESPQVQMFLVTGVSIALTIVWPLPDLEMRPVSVLYPLILATSLVYTLPVAVFIHLAALIPRPHPWFARHRGLVAAAYVLAVVLGLMSFVPYANAITPFLPWRWTLNAVLHYDARLNYAGNLIAGAACILLLQHAARFDRSPEGRRQAAVVAAAFVPWTFRQARKLVWHLPPDVERFLALLSPVTILIVALGFFVAIAGFQLFGLGRVVRKGVTFALTIAVLAGLTWFCVIVLGAGAQEVMGIRPGLWGGAAMLVAIGVAFQPLARRIGDACDEFFFREKLALRRMQRTIIPELAEITGLDRTAEHLVRRMREELGVRTAALVLADEGRRFYRVHAVVGEAEGSAREGVAPGRELLALWPAGARHPRGRSDAEPPEARRLLDLLGARWLIPVEFRGELTGVLALGEVRSGTEFDRDDFERMEILAQEVSAMLENARLFGLATRDHLTGLPHRRVFEERLALELERARRHYRPFVLGLADVDDFKRINDTLGHAAGDRVLRRVSAAVAALGRSIDVLARYGGEEFAVLLPETDADGARAFGERMRDSVADCGEDGGKVTLSAGMYVVGPADLERDPDELVRLADHALYEAKRAGKDRVILAGDEVSAAVPA